jgi:hypothetical protein
MDKKHELNNFPDDYRLKEKGKDMVVFLKHAEILRNPDNENLPNDILIAEKELAEFKNPHAKKLLLEEIEHAKERLEKK